MLHACYYGRFKFDLGAIGNAAMRKRENIKAKTSCLLDRARVVNYRLGDKSS